MPRPHYRFPLRAGNEFTLLVDSRSYFPAMLDAIGQARRSLLLEMYLFASGEVADRFIGSLAAAAQRGVRVYVLLDDYGALGLKKRDRDRLAAAGVDLAYHNPIHLGLHPAHLFRDHRKLLVADTAVAFVGGAGITDDFDTQDLGRRGWHELMVQVRGPCVADWWAVFVEHWRDWSSAIIDPPRKTLLAQGSASGRVTASSPGSGQEIKRSVLAQMHKARHRLWITTPYFAPPRRLRRALNKAARRGVDVRLLLPGPHTDHPPIRHAGRRFYGRLLAQGVRIFEYQPRFTHAKAFLCDEWVSIGSSNLDHWTLRWNLEADQEVFDTGFANSLADQLRRDLAQTREIRLEDWRARAWQERLLEHLWGWIDNWLIRHSYRRSVRRSRRAMKRGALGR